MTTSASQVPITDNFGRTICVRCRCRTLEELYCESCMELIRTEQFQLMMSLSFDVGETDEE